MTKLALEIALFNFSPTKAFISALASKMNTTMTLEEMQLLIDEGDPSVPKGWTISDFLKAREHREQVRLRCVKEYSSNPLYQARAAKDPNYWNNFYVGRYNLPKAQDDSNT